MTSPYRDAVPKRVHLPDATPSLRRRRAHRGAWLLRAGWAVAFAGAWPLGVATLASGSAVPAVVALLGATVPVAVACFVLPRSILDDGERGAALWTLRAVAVAACVPGVAAMVEPAAVTTWAEAAFVLDLPASALALRHVSRLLGELGSTAGASRACHCLALFAASKLGLVVSVAAGSSAAVAFFAPHAYAVGLGLLAFGDLVRRCGIEKREWWRASGELRDERWACVEVAKDGFIFSAIAGRSTKNNRAAPPAPVCDRRATEAWLSARGFGRAVRAPEIPRATPDLIRRPDRLRRAAPREHGSPA